MPERARADLRQAGRRRRAALLIALGALAATLGAGGGRVQAQKPVAAPPAAAQPGPDVAPMLRVETGVHQAAINRMALLPDGNSIATVSDDKTARIWSLDGLHLRATLMPPIGTGDDGGLDAVTATGKIVAIGGRIRYGNQFGVQFYRLSDSKLIGHLSDLPAPVSALRFAPDGHTLAIGMVGGRGLGFYDMSNGRQVGVDIAYTGQVQWIDTNAQGLTVTSGEDGRIRLYGPDHRKIADAVLPNGDKAYAVAFSPDGRMIAAGVQNAASVWLFDTSGLRRLKAFAGAAGRVGGFSVVAFTPDGSALLGAGSYKASNDAPRLVRRWPLSGAAATEFPAGRDTITDLLPIGPDTVVSDAVPVLSRFDSQGRVVAADAARHLDFRDAGINGFAVSADGTAVELPPPPDAPRGTTPLVFDARLRTLAPFAGGLAAPTEHSGSLQVTQWRNNAAPHVNGRAIQLDSDEVSLAAAVAPNGGGVALGTNFFVRFVRPDGTGWRAVVPSPAWAVNVSGDGRLVVAGLGDGTVRWFDATTSNELLEVFIDPATRHWAMSTPEGFFDHDRAPPGQPDGRNLLGYRFNDPPAQLSHFVEIGQFYPVFYRPDLVGQALRSNVAAQQAIRVAHEQQGPVAMVINRGLPPSVTLLDVCGQADGAPASGCPATRSADKAGPADHPDAKLATTADNVLVRYQLTSPDGDPGRVAIFRNGAVINPPISTSERTAHSLTQQAMISLGTGENTIRLLPVAGSGQVEGSNAAVVQFAVVRATPPAPPTPPPGGQTTTTTPAKKSGTKLYLLSVGVSDYGREALDLDNPANDAAAISKLMAGSNEPVYDTAVVTTLLDKNATEAAIVAGLKSITDQAGPDDLVLLFFAGHGKEVDGHYYYAPVDIGTHDPDLFKRAMAASDESGLDEVFRKEGLGSDKILPLIQDLKSTRVLMILDTCYSGAIATQDAVYRQDVNTTVTNTIGHATGRLVLSGATALAQDSSDVSGAGPTGDGKGHGLFTSYILRALQGQGDVMHTGKVDVVQLAQYTIKGVEQDTAGMQQKQSPKFFFAGNEFFAVRATKVTP